MSARPTPWERLRAGCHWGWPIGYLTVLGSAILGATLARRLELGQPWWLAALPVVVPWLWWVHRRGRNDLHGARAVLVVTAQLLLVTLLLGSLAEPRLLRVDPRLSVVYAIDHSASIGANASDEAIGFLLRGASEKPERDEVGLLFFARNAGVELPPSTALPFEGVNVEVARDGTDLGEALSTAAAMLPPDRTGRIVLVSDGVATEGELWSVVDALAARGVMVDVLGIDYGIEDEVWLEKLELPRNAIVGDTIEAAVVLSSLRPGAGQLVLEQNGTEVLRQPIDYDTGKSRFAVPLIVDATGYYEFVARVEPTAEADGFEANNVATASLYLEGEGRVLIVQSGDPRDAALWVEAARAQQRIVDVTTPAGVPAEPIALLPYDCIVFVDVARDGFDARQLEALHDAVFHQGSGFLMVGGPDSFGPGGWRASPIEELLPVDLDMTLRKQMPKGALAVILHTCEFPQGNTWGKRITLQAMQVLQPGDEVGVLAFERSGDGWLFPLTPAREYERLAPRVTGALIGDMPAFAPTMQHALTGLTASDAAAKQVVIISDGDPTPPTPELLAAYRAANIRISTVAVFPHGGGAASPDARRMRDIATQTGGRFYLPASPNELPAIFIKEARTLRRDAIQEKTFVPTIETTARMVDGLGALPPLHGYILTTPKPRALTVLEGPDEAEPDPVLARWRYGVGAAAAFTADLAPRWGRDWAAWEHGPRFAQALITDIARARTSRALAARSMPLRDEGLIEVEDLAEQGNPLDLMAVVETPQGSLEVMLDQVGPRRYEARFPLTGVGHYRASIQALGAGEGGRTHTGFAVPYGSEFLRFRADPATLRQIASRTGGRMLSGDEGGAELFDRRAAAPRTQRPIFDLLLATIMVLLPLAVAFRRLQLPRREPIARQQTVRDLLEAKQRHQQPTTPAAPTAAPATPTPAATPAEPGAAPPAPPRTAPAPQPTETDDDEKQTTMARLLARKRRSNLDEDDR